MSERKERFTPGPWSVRDKICIFRFLSVTSDKSPFVIAKVMEPNMQRILEDTTKEKANWQQLSANASLMAAAPDMYELLERLSHALFAENADEWSEEINFLLAKARGEEA